MAIRGYKLRKRGDSWQVDLGRKITGGVRIQRSFRSKAKAVAWATRKLRELTIIGSEAARLSDEDFGTAAKALWMMREKGFPAELLVNAVAFYIIHHASEKPEGICTRACHFCSGLQDCLPHATTRSDHQIQQPH